MYGPIDHDLIQFEIQQHIRKAERVRLASQALRERREQRRSRSATSGFGGLRRTVLYVASALGRML